MSKGSALVFIPLLKLERTVWREPDRNFVLLQNRTQSKVKKKKKKKG